MWEALHLQPTQPLSRPTRHKRQSHNVLSAFCVRSTAPSTHTTSVPANKTQPTVTQCSLLTHTTPLTHHTCSAWQRHTTLSLTKTHTHTNSLQNSCCGNLQSHWNDDIIQITLLNCVISLDSSTAPTSPSYTVSRSHTVKPFTIVGNLLSQQTSVSLEWLNSLDYIIRLHYFTQHICCAIGSLLTHTVSYSHTVKSFQTARNLMLPQPSVSLECSYSDCRHSRLCQSLDKIALHQRTTSLIPLHRLVGFFTA